jgi:hypothetical protein
MWRARAISTEYEATVLQKLVLPFLPSRSMFILASVQWVSRNPKSSFFFAGSHTWHSAAERGYIVV